METQLTSPLAPSDTLSLTDVCKILQLPKRSVNQFVREGKLECYQITPRKRLFSQEHIERFLRAREKLLPKPIDRKTPSSVPYSRKGGEKSKSSRDSVRAQLKEEMRSW